MDTLIRACKKVFEGDTEMSATQGVTDTSGDQLVGGPAGNGAPTDETAGVEQNLAAPRVLVDDSHPASALDDNGVPGAQADRHESISMRSTAGRRAWFRADSTPERALDLKKRDTASTHCTLEHAD